MGHRKKAGKTRKADMNWKKNGISYLIWIGYVLMTGTAIVSLGSAMCAEVGVAAWAGFLAAAIYLLLVGAVVLGLHKTSCSRLAVAERNRKFFLAAEAVLAVFLLAAGVVLRVNAMSSAEGGREYFEIAAVAEGKTIPLLVHGAEYLYLQLLHGVFLLLGNQYAAGIWLQIVLQLIASVGLYLIMHRLAGAVSALIAFGFCMCAPYMIQASMVLSPEMLYFLLLVMVVGTAVWVSGGSLHLCAFSIIGFLIAFCCYLDINGILLLVMAFGLAFSERERTSFGRKLAAAGICLLTTVSAFFIFIWADAFMSGKSSLNVVQAWFQLYQGTGFRLPFGLTEAGPEWENAILFGLLAFGIFGFWRDREKEYLAPYVLAVWVVMTVGCFGIFTEAMPGFFTLYILFVLVAATGTGQCFRGTVRLKNPSEGSNRYGSREKKVPEELPTDKIHAEEGMYRDVGFAMEAGEKASFETDGQEAGNGGSRQEQKKIHYLENPLPLPKKHVKRVLEYSVKVSDDDDFDHPVGDGEDFDL